MVWFFVRDDETATCEVSHLGRRYSIATHADREGSVQIVDYPAALIDAIHEVAEPFIRDGWTPVPPDPLTGEPTYKPR